MVLFDLGSGLEPPGFGDEPLSGSLPAGRLLRDLLI